MDTPIANNLRITAVDVKDIRFPTSLNRDGSDAMHTDPDYSCVYVTIETNKGYKGYGLTFTLGRGTEIVAQACKSLATFLMHRKLSWIYDDFGAFWRRLTSDSQLRWVGPEKGVIHLATAAIINALWDLWARIEGKPVWKLLSDMSPEKLVSVMDFRYIRDVVDEFSARKILEDKQKFREEQEKKLLENGYPAYTTQVGWLGYSDQQLEDLCQKFLNLGYTAFKIKVGQNLQDDIRRCEVIRKVIGKLKPHGIGVATGEMCANRIMFKQFLKCHAISYCQVDSARIGGINEILAVYLMAYITKIPVCPHAGGVGLCEMIQHLQMWDYICLSQTTENRIIEFVDQQHEHFVDPVCIKNACYMPPMRPGYSTEPTINIYVRNRTKCFNSTRFSFCY